MSNPSHPLVLPASAIVIVPCTARKSIPVPREASAVSLPLSPQSELETVWNNRVVGLARTAICSEFYSGRGMCLAREAARTADARMYVASAGLGLVAAEAMIAPYAVTVGARGLDAVAARTIGRFNPRSWWESVTRGPCSSKVGDVFASARGGLALVALSRPYAEMMAEYFSGLSAEDLVGLRLFGWRLEAVFDRRLHDSIMPYDARLDTLKPGTRCDYPQRALSHFVRTFGVAFASAERHRSRVLAALDGLAEPDRPTRLHVSDRQIVSWIGEDGNAFGGIGASLRALRSKGIACEQKRFSRLYREAMQGRVAA